LSKVGAWAQEQLTWGLSLQSIRTMWRGRSMSRLDTASTGKMRDSRSLVLWQERLRPRCRRYQTTTRRDASGQRVQHVHPSKGSSTSHGRWRSARRLSRYRSARCQEARSSPASCASDHAVSRQQPPVRALVAVRRAKPTWECARFYGVSYHGTVPPRNGTRPPEPGRAKRKMCS